MSNLKKLAKKIPHYDQLTQPLHYLKAFHAASKNNYPGATMKIIGVTGTNGKTTTTWMVYSILREKFGDKVGVMSTIGWGWGDQIEDQTAHATTESPEVLQRHLARMREAGVEYVVLEVSSHALAQHRVFGILFDVAVFTNLSPDHLDYHKTMTKYREAKERLFHLAANNRNGKRLGIINGDDPAGRFFASDIPIAIRYGLRNDDNDLSAQHVKLSANAIEYDLNVSTVFAKNLANDNFKNRKSLSLHIKTHLPGEFNVYNSLAAVAIGLEYNLSGAEIVRGLANLRSVPGSMNTVEGGQGFNAIIDFATTPDAFENVLPGIRRATKGHVISLFGLPGQRDQTKAADMGKVAAKYSDVIILTEDDARGSVRAQSNKIADGIPGNYHGQVKFIDDRTDAINAAMKLARPSDTVVLLGKGPEKIIARKIGNKIVDQPWDEEATARAAIRKTLPKIAKISTKSSKTAAKTKGRHATKLA